MQLLTLIKPIYYHLNSSLIIDMGKIDTLRLNVRVKVIVNIKL